MNCLNCDSKMDFGPVVIDGEYRHRMMRVAMDGFQCPACGYTTIRGRDMAEFDRRLKEQYRLEEAMVGPGELKAARKQFDMLQAPFADFLGIGLASLKRIEAGAVPERLANEHIRLRLYPEEFETFFSDQLWKVNAAKGALAELPAVAAQCSEVWNGVLKQCYSLIETTNYDYIFTKCLAQLQETTAMSVEATLQSHPSKEDVSQPVSCDNQYTLAA